MSKKPKKKRKIIEYETFLNDEDGLSQRDYLLMISTFVFFFFISTALSLSLFGKEISDTYLELLNIVSPVIMTIVASVFAIEGVERVTDSIKHKKDNKVDEIEQIEEIVEPIQIENEEEM